MFDHATGVLLHPSSLPGPWGIGTMGSEAVEFADWIADSGVKVWQVLPLSPPVYGNSPYQSLCSFAGNPLLISPETLFKQGLISSMEFDSARSKSLPSVDWSCLSGRFDLLAKAAARGLKTTMPGFDEFSHLPWVREWSWFAARKELNNGLPWTRWTNTVPLEPGKQKIHAMIQYLFHQQWTHLKKHCSSIGVSILGDIPIYTAHDSADVFFNRNLFKLDEAGYPSVVAGVPPDYFSSTGQLWGNPVYDWEECRNSGFNWWTRRVARALELFDSVRIDHFRGFAEYWEIPAGETTAVNGKWVKGPGIELFREMEKTLGSLPVVAENLGVITQSVKELLELCGFPGMVVLQFALADSGFSLDGVDPSSVIYTGTHDNDTTAGWIKKQGYKLGYNSVRSVVEAALSSPADLAVLPMQDILELGSSARMNKPSTTRGNWSWRMTNLPELPRSLGRG